ncbi:MAG: cbb3-type cytochrome c oxidase subunit II [Terracidiphilus sp.]
MLQAKVRNSGWRAGCLIAITYVYFLIFAQFAFLNRLAALGIAGQHLKSVMAAMAVSGILFSLLTPRINLCPSPALRLRFGLGTAGAAAFLTLLPMRTGISVTIALLIGAGLGLLTVTLVTHLREWIGTRNPLIKIGLGTGIGYLLCNVSPFFSASPQVQAVTAGILCIGGIIIAPHDQEAQPIEVKLEPSPASSFPFIVACFAVLVWLDSAVFFIVQNTPMLKAGTWQGTIHLGANGVLHLGAALLSAWLLRHRGVSFVLTAAFFALAFACMLLIDPARALPASVFYPIGVSLYSVALVAYPSLLSPATTIAERGRLAGWIYAIAGWAASALGIGMGQNLGHVPPLFVAAAGTVVLFPILRTLLRLRVREILLTSVILLSAFCVYRLVRPPSLSASLTPVERGRQVYISEGCINCHSQYVRPGTRDVLMWGPVESLAELHSQRPPLIGNRRQGPDLAEVGARRSALWLKMHFFNPAEVSGASIMPLYGFLFRDGRGNDLVAYLESLHGQEAEQHIAAENQWHLSTAAVVQANAAEGHRLYGRYCATCHSEDGPTRLTWQASFSKLPPNLATGPLTRLSQTDSPASRMDRLARIAKFGIPDTDMPGHEYLSDKDFASISLWLSQNIARQEITRNNSNHPGEEP